MAQDRYRRGAHTVLDLQYHYVWKTKYGYHLLRGDIALRLRDVLREICGQKEVEIIRGNVRSNHVHLLVRLPSYLSPGKGAQCLKGKSAYLLFRAFPELKKRY